MTKEQIEEIMEEAEIQLYNNWDSWASDMNKLRKILKEHLQEPTLTYEQWFERWKQVGYKEWWRARGEEPTEEREVEIKNIWENKITFTNYFDCTGCWWHIYWWATAKYCSCCWAKIKRVS